MRKLWTLLLLISWLVGDYGAPLQRVVIVDVVGLAALGGAMTVDALWLRTSPV
jgi:hypothetical protein